MIIDNVYVFTPDKAFVKGGIILDGDKIRQVYEEKDAPQLSGDVMDGKGCYAIPGLIDLHFMDVREMMFAMVTKKLWDGLLNMRHP
mgnify:CR=1 FL=1